jgi:hypothetical protein
MEPTPMLQMNFEQDSSGKPGEWAAYFTDVQGSIYVGRAATPRPPSWTWLARYARK